VVARNVYEIGTCAARLMIERLTSSAHAGPSRTVTIPTRLIVRGSTAPPHREI
jgi:DNA-binding LacI/PurR family transcriptional regulator